MASHNSLTCVSRYISPVDVISKMQQGATVQVGSFVKAVKQDANLEEITFSMLVIY